MPIHYGFLFDPQVPNHQIDSVTLVLEDDNISLKVNHEFINHKCPNILLGCFNSIGDISLFDCQIMSFQSGYGASVTTLKPRFLISGIHCASVEELTFRSISVRCEMLDDWIRRVPIGFCEIDGKKTLTINEAKTQTITISEEIELEIFQHVNQSFGQRKYAFSPFTRFQIKSLKSDLELSSLLQYVNDFKNFLAVITHQYPEVKGATLRKSTIQSKSSINLYFNGKSIGTDLGYMTYGFKYSEIVDQIPYMIQQWFLNQQLRQVSEIILEKVYYPSLSSENRFLNSCFAIESFHRIFNKTTIFKKSEFREIKNSILETIDRQDIRQWFVDKNSHTNEPSFKARLIDFKQYFDLILPEKTKTDNYIRAIVKTRNSLVHKNFDKNALTGVNLSYCSIYLDTIVRACTFEKLGLEAQLVNTFLTKSKYTIEGFWVLNKSLTESILRMPKI